MIQPVHLPQTEAVYGNLPFVVLFLEDSTHQADHGSLIREDAHHIDSVPHLFVQPFEHVVVVDPLPILGGKSHVSQDHHLSFEEHLRRLGSARRHGVVDRSQLVPGDFLVGLGIDRAQGRRHHRLVATRYVREQVPHTCTCRRCKCEMHPAALPAGPREHLGDRGLQAFMGIADHQLHALQAALHQRLKEFLPKSLRSSRCAASGSSGRSRPPVSTTLATGSRSAASSAPACAHAGQLPFSVPPPAPSASGSSCVRSVAESPCLHPVQVCGDTPSML